LTSISSGGHAPTQMTSSLSYPPNQAKSMPSLPTVRPPQRRPKLSLVNYAAPSPPVTQTAIGTRPLRSPLHSPSLSTVNAPNPFFSVPEVRVTPPPSPKDERGHKPMPPSAVPGWACNTIIGGQPATSPSFEPQSNGISLKWPWGLGSNFKTELYTGFGSAPGSSGSGSSSPQAGFSPQTLSPLSITPANSNSGSPQSGSGNSSPNTGIDADADKLYNAFVKQWCFAQSPKPSPGYNGFSTIDGFSEGVLVG